MRLTSLAAVARRTGFPVVEEHGWRGRGVNFPGPVRSILCHHDAANQAPWQFNTVVRDGRSDLPGPLSQFTIRRDGTIHVVADGRANHAGVTINDSVWGGNYSIGIEAANNGVGEPWPRYQLDAYEALVAELCREFGLGVDRVRGHKEVASPLGRKIDPAGIDMNGFRAAVAHRIHVGPGGGGSTPPPAIVHPTNYLEEHNMELTPGQGQSRTLVVPTGAKSLVISLGWKQATIHKVGFFGFSPATGVNQLSEVGSQVIDPARPYIVAVPNGALTCEINYDLEDGGVSAGAGFRTDF